MCHSNGSWIPQFTCLSSKLILKQHYQVPQIPSSNYLVCMDTINVMFIFFSNAVLEMSPLTPKVQITPVLETGLIAVLSSLIVIVCIISSIVFGYVCGWFGYKYKQSHAKESNIRFMHAAEMNTLNATMTNPKSKDL